MRVFYSHRETDSSSTLPAGKHTVFGRLVGGQDVLDKLERVPIDPATDRPLKPVILLDVEVFGDPFEDYKGRLEKRLKREQEEREGRGEKARRKAEREKDRTTCVVTLDFRSAASADASLMCAAGSARTSRSRLTVSQDSAARPRQASASTSLRQHQLRSPAQALNGRILSTTARATWCGSWASRTRERQRRRSARVEDLETSAGGSDFAALTVVCAKLARVCIASPALVTLSAELVAGRTARRSLLLGTAASYRLYPTLKPLSAMPSGRAIRKTHTKSWFVWLFRNRLRIAKSACSRMALPQRKRQLSLSVEMSVEGSLGFRSSIWHMLSNNSSPPQSRTSSCAALARALMASVRPDGGRNETMPRNWAARRWSCATAAEASGDGLDGRELAEGVEGGISTPSADAGGAGRVVGGGIKV